MGVDHKMRRLRREMCDDGEALLERDAAVVAAGAQSNTPYVSPTQEGAEIAGIELGETVSVHVFEDGIWISTDD